MLTSAMISGNPHESQSVYSVSHNCVVSLTCLVPLFLPPYFPQEFPSASYFLTEELCICTHHLLDEFSLVPLKNTLQSR